MGKKAVPQANPSAMKQPGRERRRGAVEVLTLSALPPSPEVIRHAERRRRHARRSNLSRVIAAGSLPVVAVRHIPMKQVCLERPCRQQGEWQSRGRKSTTRLLGAVHAAREFLTASKGGGNGMDKVKISRRSVNAMQVSRR